MNRFRNSLIALTGAIGIALSVTTSWAGEGHDHDEAPVAAGPLATAVARIDELSVDPGVNRWAKSSSD